MWKVKIKGLDQYTEKGFEFYEDEDFLYVFDRWYPVDLENPDEPLAVFTKAAQPNIIKSFLEGYLKIRDIM